MNSKQIRKKIQEYKYHPAGEARRKSAVVLAKTVLRMPLLRVEHKKRILNIAVWLTTQSDGRYNLRYMSEGTYQAAFKNFKDVKLNHEHVLRKKLAVIKMLGKKANVEKILSDLTACLVTVDEHRKLGGVEKMDKELDGWRRYRKAGIKVWDRQTQKWKDLSARRP